MFDNSLTRYGNVQGGGGVSSDTPTGFFSDWALQQPGKYHTYFNDFDTYAAGDWTVTTVTSGSPTQALTAAQGGVLALTNTTGTTDSTVLQLKTASFQLVGSTSSTGGLRNWGSFLVKVSSTAPSLFLGLINTTTTPSASVTDGIYLTNVGTALTASIVANSGTPQTLTATTGALPTLVAGQYFRFSWYYDGGVYSAGVGKVTLELSGSGVSANWRNEIVCGSTFPFTTLLNPTMQLLNTTGIASVLSVDSVFVSQDRGTIAATPTF